MRLYDIDQAIMECVDFETGEVFDPERLDALQMERTAKLENVALWVKNLMADAKAIREEEKALASRRQRMEKKVESLNQWLTNALQGEKLSTPKVAVSFRRSEGLDVIDNDSFCLWAMGNERDDLLKFTAPTIDAAAVKKAIKDGADIPYARIEERLNINIK
jgi:hypothetical protein